MTHWVTTRIIPRAAYGLGRDDIGGGDKGNEKDRPYRSQLRRQEMFPAALAIQTKMAYDVPVRCCLWKPGWLC